MPVKSVIDIEVNDEAFKEFAGLFEKYREALGQTPGQWAKVEAASGGTALNVENLVAGLLTHEAINRKIAREEAEKTRQIERQRKAFLGMTVPARDVARSVTNIVTTLAKWATYGSVGAGLLGFGGLLGLDRLANVTGAGRRNAQGLGAGYGETKAFTNSYDRIVDANGFLSGVNESLTDVTKRASLFGAGLSNKDIAGKDTAQVANELIPLLKRIADKTPDSQLAQVLQARGLGQFVTVEDLRRLKATSPKELKSIQGGYASKASQFDVEDRVARKWQDLGVQLDSAKIKIEGVLVKGLEPLAKPLAELSDSVANALKNFLTGLDPSTIKDIGKNIEDFGKYLGSPQFRTDIKEFAGDVSYAAKKIASALKWLGLIPDNSPEAVQNSEAEHNRQLNLGDGGNRPVNYAEGSWRNTDPKRTAHWYDPGSWLQGKGGLGDMLSNKKTVLGESARWTPRPNDSNPGNIRMPGTSQGFAQFEGGADAGVRAIARQVQLYEKRDHLDTIAKIIGKYAPGGSDGNNVKAYVDDVSKYTGMKADQRIDPNDSGTLAKIVAGITKHEGRKRYTTEQVKVIIQNNTGGSAVVQSSQAAKQG